MRSLITCVMFGSTLLSGCNVLNASHFYSVRVKNASGESIKDVKIVFEKSTWTFDYGSVGNGLAAGHTSDEMPSPPSSFEISWVDAGGKKQKNVTLSEPVRENVITNKLMLIAIDPNDEVTVQ